MNKRKIKKIVKYLDTQALAKIVREQTYNLNNSVVDIPSVFKTHGIKMNLHYNSASYRGILNNSHMPHRPILDRLFRKYQEIEIMMDVDCELIMPENINFIKIKYPNDYRIIIDRDSLNSQIYTLIFVGIMNLDNKFHGNHCI